MDLKVEKKKEICLRQGDKQSMLIPAWFGSRAIPVCSAANKTLWRRKVLFMRSWLHISSLALWPPPLWNDDRYFWKYIMVKEKSHEFFFQSFDAPSIRISIPTSHSLLSSHSRQENGPLFFFPFSRGSSSYCLTEEADIEVGIGVWLIRFLVLCCSETRSHC